MIALRTLIVLFAAALAATSAIPATGTDASPSPTPNDEHAGHQPEASASAPTAAMDPRMKAMQEMHQKMMNARTPEEREALMADHMKAMQDGMAMMKEMSGMGGMSAMSAKPPMAGMGAMSDGKGMPADMGKRHQMMEQRMDTMQMMMEMMMDRMPPTPAKKQGGTS